MTDLRARMINWGLHVGGYCGPEGFAPVAPMFRNAPVSKWWDEAWGDSEAAIEEITPPIDEKDAEIIDKLVLGIKSERLKLALLIEYARAPKSFRFRRYNYDDSVNEAFRLMQDLTEGQSKKAQALRLLAEGKHTGAHIADVVGCSEAFVCQLKG
jgi:hypothetical protein